MERIEAVRKGNCCRSIAGLPFQLSTGGRYGLSANAKLETAFLKSDRIVVLVNAGEL